ncbi:hypothetical protein CAPTEDRAFT_225571 [Capitella teleta]|uniref:Actin interacting protein 3 C-terminal domain-containing protein n=1 Tax=Capitella teleta TaxID=283909 RepID=R7U3Q3_CAPTE|nr:hypothetical protein CAPTEDRAFT_225571 [Capitella teleta]|eukprot:ELU00619.1 hypothetical protein CAPTEDRAFT_225571 [Capitella teleta]
MTPPRNADPELDIYFGQVFLTFRNETKRALLPNELTSIDTIRALFVRSFPDALSMQLFESAAKRIYILEAATSVFYELDDLRDVRDKSVLKVIERTGALPPAPPSPLRSPALRRTEMLGSSGAFPGYDSDSSTRSAPVNGPRSPAHGRPPASPRLFHYEVKKTSCDLKSGGNVFRDQVPSKVGSLPVQPNYMSMEQIRRQAASRGAPWSPTRGRGSGESAPSRSNQSSPQRTPLLPPGVPPNPQRHSVAYLPDQGGVYGHIPMQQSRSYHDYPDADGASSQSGSITPTHDNKETKVRMEKMEVQLANLQAWVEHAAQCKAKSVPTSEGGSVRSVASAVSGSSSSVKSKSNNSTPTFESPGQPGMSDLSSATPQPFISVDLQNSVSSLHKKAVELKAELARLREAQLSNQQTMRHMIEETFAKIKETMATVAPSNPAPASGASKRDTVNHLVNEYKNESQRVNKDLGDLVASVEELRIDVLNKKCRVNLSEVESMALALSHISKSLADLKSKFPSLSDNMKTVMAAEIEEVVSEEKFIKEEPDNLDNSLKKCKKLTSTLFTLKRLAAVQDQRPPQIPQFKTDKAADRNELMGNIMAMVPDHEARLQSLQATEQSRERKMKIVAGSESLKFSKSIEIAQKQLKETHNITANELRQEKLLSEIYSTVKKVYEEPAQKAVEKLYEEPTQLKNDVPKKPPRTMEYGSSDESVNVSAISAVVSAGNSRMATFTSNESSSPKPVVAEINPMTSTPKNHVTFSGTVVEITDSKAGGGKKVPPPPPPRKSSAKLSSPVSKIQQMPLPPTPESPPTYENLDTLRQKKQRPKSSEVVREKSSVGNRPRSDGPTIQDLYAKVQQQNKNGGDTTEDSGGSSSSLDSQKGGKRPESSAIPQRKVSCEESAYCTVKEVAYKNNGQNVAQLQKSLFNGGQKSVARQPDVTKQRTMSKNHEETEIY